MFSSLLAATQRFIRARMALWLWISLALAAAIACIAPQLLHVSLYKLSLITSAAWAAYWLDVHLFPYARPDAYLDLIWDEGSQLLREHLPTDADRLRAFSAAMHRRALIIAAGMIAIALGA